MSSRMRATSFVSASTWRVSASSREAQELGVIDLLSSDSQALLKAAQLPTRKDRRWEVELAPLTRMQAWQVQEIKPGTAVSVVGFTLREEKGDAVLRAEYLFVDGKAYGLRSSPA